MTSLPFSRIGAVNTEIPGDGLGFLRREPAEAYHARAKDHLSSHQLARFRECPLLYRKEHLGMLPQSSSPALHVGKAAHVLVLEGREAYRRQFAVGGPTNPATGKPYHPRSKEHQDWARLQSRPVLTDCQAALIEEMAAGVSRHPAAQELLSDGVAEGVIRCDYRGAPCQARLDWLSPSRGLVDLKTCEDLDGFERDARVFGYVHQMAFYRALLTLQTDRLFAVHLIAVEKREPYRCGVWRIDPRLLAAAERDNELAIDRLLQCHRDDCWTTGYESVRVLSDL